MTVVLDSTLDQIIKYEGSSTSREENYMYYEDNTKMIHEEIIDNIKLYDENAGYIDELMETIGQLSKTAEAKEKAISVLMQVQPIPPPSKPPAAAEPPIVEAAASAEPPIVEAAASAEPPIIEAAKVSVKKEPANECPTVPELQMSPEKSQPSLTITSVCHVPDEEFQQAQTEETFEPVAQPENVVDTIKEEPVEAIKGEPVESMTETEEETAKDVKKETIESAEEDEEVAAPQPLKQSDSDIELFELRMIALKSMFQNKIRKKKDAVLAQYIRYMREPETHPKYEEEWKRFYTECSYEILMRQMTTHSFASFNYVPEWIAYWKLRVHELKLDEIMNFISDLRTQLGLDGVEDDDNAKFVEKSVEEVMQSTCTVDDDVQIIEPHREIVDLVAEDASDEDPVPLKRIKIEKNTETEPSTKKVVKELFSSSYRRKKAMIEEEKKKEIVRMKTAIEIALYLHNKGKMSIDASQLLELADYACKNAVVDLLDEKFQISDNEEEEEEDYESQLLDEKAISNSDYKVLIRTFHKLNAQEQVIMIGRLDKMKIDDPLRFRKFSKYIPYLHKKVLLHKLENIINKQSGEAGVE